MIWLIGNKGMLGTDVEASLRNNSIPYTATDKEIDITDIEALKNFTADKNIKWIINCSAYTAVDLAEDEEDVAYKINGDGPHNLALIAKKMDAKIIHFSTDYVFNGEKDPEYFETDNTGPQSVYGKSKLQGENKIRDTWNKHFIIRLSWLFGENGNNFIKTMLRLFENNNTVRVVNDQWGSPTYTKELSELIIKVVKTDSADYGIYNYSCEGRINWYQFAKEIYDRSRELNKIKREVEIVPIPTTEFKTKAKRPKNSYLNKDKVKKTFNIEINSWKDSLDTYLKGIKNN